MRLLLVEDDTTFCKVLADALARDEPELEVVTAGTLDGALAEAERAPFALILMDAGLPLTPADARAGRVDPRVGERLLERLEQRRDGDRRVVLSAQDRDRAVRLMLTHRIHDYLFKDTPWPEVRVRLRAQLEQLQLEERNRALAGGAGEDGAQGCGSHLGRLSSRLTRPSGPFQPKRTRGRGDDGPRFGRRQAS